MNRRDFFRLTGLGAGSLFLASAVLASPWREEWEAGEAVRFAVELARAHGAEYVDARIGPCEVIGRHGAGGSVELLQSDLLGMRICMADGWRIVVMRDWGKEAIGESLPLALRQGVDVERNRGIWSGDSRSESPGKPFGLPRDVSTSASPSVDMTAGGTWVAAQFCKEKVLAHLTTDAITESQLNTSWLRFGTRPPLPPDSTQFRFCDILLHQ